MGLRSLLLLVLTCCTYIVGCLQEDVPVPQRKCHRCRAAMGSVVTPFREHPSHFTRNSSIILFISYFVLAIILSWPAPGSVKPVCHFIYIDIYCYISRWFVQIRFSWNPPLAFMIFSIPSRSIILVSVFPTKP